MRLNCVFFCFVFVKKYLAAENLILKAVIFHHWKLSILGIVRDEHAMQSST